MPLCLPLVDVVLRFLGFDPMPHSLILLSDAKDFTFTKRLIQTLILFEDWCVALLLNYGSKWHWEGPGG